MREIIVLVILVFSATFLHAQKECVEELMRSVERMGKMDLPEPGKTYHLEMTIENTFREKTNIPEVIHIESTISKFSMFYKSELMSVYQDTADMFTVLHPSKTIVRYRNTNNEDYEKRRANVLDKQLSLLEKCTVINCFEPDNGERDIRIINMQPDSTISSQTGADLFTIHFNKKSKSIKKISISYGSDNVLKRQEITYNDINWNYKTRISEVPVRLLFYDDSGEIKPRYQGYKVIDNRS